MKVLGRDGSYQRRGALAVTTLPEGAVWSYELKFDGYRALGVKAAGQVRLLSRNGKDLTKRFAPQPSALWLSVHFTGCQNGFQSSKRSCAGTQRRLPLTAELADRIRREIEHGAKDVAMRQAEAGWDSPARRIRRDRRARFLLNQLPRSARGTSAAPLPALDDSAKRMADQRDPSP